MRINWLIEEFSRDNSFLEIKEAALKRGHQVKVVESVPFLYDPHWSLFPKGSRTVFLGSIQCAKQLQRSWQHHMWNPGVWCSWDQYKCSTYYAHWGEFVFNTNYTMLPLGDFNRKRHRFMDRSVFIRPDAGDKPFTGQVFTPEDIESKLWQISTEDMKPEDLILLSSDKRDRLNREWRVVCSKGKVITGSRYKTAGLVDYQRELPDDVREFAQKVIATEWQPDPIYVLDICSDHRGWLYLLEIGALSVAGLYHCDFDLIVEAVETAVKGNITLTSEF
jgi:hypothetical protein